MTRKYTLLNFFSFILILFVVSGCGYLNVDPYHYLVRSDIITTPEIHNEVINRAKVGYTENGKIRVLYLRGTAYERGYQHGVLLRHEVRENLQEMYKNALKTFYSEELFAEAYERARPYISQEYIDEMRGLAHGSKLPLKIIHFIHILPELTEWSGKKRLREIVHQMIEGAIGPSCSNISVFDTASKDSRMYTVRILDWGLHRISKLHQYPLITISVPDRGYASANIGWVGFIGAVSGINERGITLGEMGNGSPEGETLTGTPMPFVLRDILTKADSLADARRIIKTSPGTNAYGYLISDGKRKEAELYIRDKKSFTVFKQNQDIKSDRKNLPGIENTVYAGHFDEKMNTILSEKKGSITPELLMNEIIPEIAMKSNFQNVVYDPKALTFWVNNAKSKNEPAHSQPYTFFDFGKALKDFLGKNTN